MIDLRNCLNCIHCINDVLTEKPVCMLVLLPVDSHTYCRNWKNDGKPFKVLDEANKVKVRDKK